VTGVAVGRGVGVGVSVGVGVEIGVSVGIGVEVSVGRGVGVGISVSKATGVEVSPEGTVGAGVEASQAPKKKPISSQIKSKFSVFMITLLSGSNVSKAQLYIYPKTSPESP
jgi:hypothetical protein